MRTRGSLSRAGNPASPAGGPSSLAAPAAAESRRELRPRRRTGQATEIRGAPPGATKPHAAVPRTGGRVTRRLAAQLAANSDDSPSDESFTLSTQIDVPIRTHTSTSRPRRLAASVSQNAHSSRSSAPTPRAHNSRLGKRTRPQSGFYDEDDEDSDQVEESDLDEDHARISPSTDGNRQHAPVNRTRRTTPRSSNFKRAKLVKSPKNRKIKGTSAQPSSEEQSTENEFVPDWLSLDYFIWVQIFEVAAASLDDRDGVNWLLSTSRICKTFAEPAITALYRCPALLSRPMAHQLLSLLTADPSTTSFNYRAKVEKLRIDVGVIASKSHKGQHLDFGALVNYLPRLKVIDLHHSADNPPYRRFNESLRWHYPDGLFGALNNTPDAGLEVVASRQPTRLIGWRWNSRMMGTGSDQETLDKIRTLHLKPCFSNLKRLSFVNFQVPSLDVENGADDPAVVAKDQAFVQGIADAICALPDLEHLSMESSTVVNDYFLPLLPKTLKTLELVNCWDVNGEDFTNYLLTHGHKLQHLFLHHNQSLSLAFLTVLGTACPSLKTLRMDLKTFNHHEFYNDSEPSYDQVLAGDQVPHWPVSLETLELKNMRKWEAAGAESLFQSLVDSASTLPNLRCLDLKAMLDIPFRQRSELRDKWEARIKRVFLRKLEDPQPFGSLRVAPVGSDGQSHHKAQKSKKCKSVESPSRRSGRIATQISRPSSRDSSMGRGLRRNLQGRPSYAEPDTDDDELAFADEGENSDAESSPNGATPERNSEPSIPGSPFEEFFHHGLCETVEIQLDNQKPAERTLTMEDFLDETASDDPSDEDWDGDQDDDDRLLAYAW